MPRHWTLPEANQALPQLRLLLHEGQDALARLQEARAQVEDVRLLYGDASQRPGSPEAAELQAWQEKARDAEAGLEAVGLKFAAIGVEVKDVAMGLVDFRARLGESEVYLCWKLDEPEIRWWHTLDGGFSRRHPIPDFTPVT